MSNLPFDIETRRNVLFVSGSFTALFLLRVPSFVCVFICCCQVVIGCSLSIVFLSYQLYFGPFSPHTVSFRFLLRFRASTSFSATFFCHSILRSAYLYFVNCIHILQEIVLIKKKQYIPSKYLINWKYVIAFSDCHLMKKKCCVKNCIFSLLANLGTYNHS